MKNEINLSANCGYSSAITGLSGGITGTTTFKIETQYGTPELVRFDEFEDRLEFIYIETSNIIYTVYPSPPPERRVFKIIFSCVDGKWNKSEKIYGEIIPATEEYYDF